jgi:hypothetical protein
MTAEMGYILLKQCCILANTLCLYFLFIFNLLLFLIFRSFIKDMYKQMVVYVPVVVHTP